MGASLIEDAERSKHIPLGRTRDPPWELSLVAHKIGTTDVSVCATVSFVHWTWPPALKCRIPLVSASPPYRVMWPTPGSHPEIKLCDAQVIHAAIGVVAKKTKDPDLHAVISNAAMRLKCMWEQVQAAHDDAAGRSPMVWACTVCAESDDSVVRCSLCLLPMHRCCASALLRIQREPTSGLAVLPPRDGPFPLPPLFVSEPDEDIHPMCPLCTDAFSPASPAAE